MIEYGFESHRWMAKAVLMNAHPARLRQSSIELMEWLYLLQEDKEISAYEIIDRLLQVAVTGEYHTSHDITDLVKESIRLADEILGEPPIFQEREPTAEEDEILKAFREQRDQFFPAGESPEDEDDYTEEG